jgi:ribosomal protein S18 acetylase RimI-like enzyme
MIRHAKPSEIDEIITITRACAAKMISESIFQWNENYPSKAAFQEDSKRNELYVLTEAESILGCIVISSVKDAVYNEVEWLTPDTNQFYIHRLAVDPKYQGLGYAGALMEFAERLALEKEISSIRLDTFSKNIRNQGFYEARGYQRLGKIYFPNQSDFPFYCYELIISNS